MKLSVILPVYNVEKYIIDCLKSINNVLGSDCECIIIDDGSTDDSYNLCYNYVKNKAQFKLIHIDNHGVSYARNLGIQRAKGEYITFVDSDDIIKFIDLEFLRGDNIYSLNIAVLEEENVKFKKFKNRKNICDNFIRYPMYMNSVCNKFFKKKIIDQFNLTFDEKQYAAEDLLFLIKYLIKSKSEICYLDIDYYIYRMNNTSLSHKKLSCNIIENYYVTYKKIDNLCSKYNEKETYAKLLRFLRLKTSILYLLDIDCFDVNKFRNRTIKTDVWTYDRRVDIFIISLCAQLHIDIVPYMYILLKKMRSYFQLPVL